MTVLKIVVFQKEGIFRLGKSCIGRGNVYIPQSIPVVYERVSTDMTASFGWIITFTGGQRLESAASPSKGHEHKVMRGVSVCISGDFFLFFGVCTDGVCLLTTWKHDMDVLHPVIFSCRTHSLAPAFSRTGPPRVRINL